MDFGELRDHTFIVFLLQHVRPPRKPWAGYGWTQLTSVALHPGLVTFIGLGYARRLQNSIKWDILAIRSTFRERKPMKGLDAPHKNSLDLAMQRGFQNNCKYLKIFVTNAICRSRTPTQPLS